MTDNATRSPAPGPIERFWSARDASIVLDADGFLRDPSPNDWLGSRNTQARSTETLRGVRCLVLLGEPGSGKSTALGMDPSLPAAVGILPEGFLGTLTAISLTDFRSEDRVATLLDADPALVAWAAGEGELALVLDAFDECQAGVEHLGRMLSNRVARWPTERMVLRIACRTAQWPAALESRLKAEFGDGLEVVEISPLRAADAAAIAEGRRLDGSAVVAAVRAGHVGALAARPLLLGMILDDFVGGTVPSDAVTLYRRSTARLSVEYDELRAGPPPAATGEAALAVARRIAAAVVFDARPAIRVGSTPARDDLTIADLVGGDEPAGRARFDVTGNAVGQLLTSGLFNSRGRNRFGFAHYSFAEFLAAEWLDANAMPDDKLAQLLHASDGVVMPTLRNVAAWLMAFDPDRYGWISDDDPDVILSGAVDVPSAEIRGRVVDRILDGGTSELWQHRHYAGLGFDGLADRLRPQLRSVELERALLASEIAMDCGVVDLTPDLVEVALDGSVPMSVRIRAALAVLRFGETNPTAALAPLVTAPLDEDRADELRGVALDASWPHAVDLPTVLEMLAPPKHRNLFGTYRHFVTYQLAPSLTTAHLDVALPWLVELEREDGPDHHLETLADRIVTLACEAPADATRDELLALLLWRRTTHGKGMLLDSFHSRVRVDPLADDGRRRDVIRALLRVMDDQTGYIWYLTERAEAVCRPKDFGWIASHVGSLDEAGRERAVSLAQQVFHADDRGCVDALLALDDGHPVREQLRPWWIDAWPLDHPQRTSWMRQQERLGPSAAEVERRINEALDAFENGDTLGFVRADLDVGIEPGSREPGDPLPLPLMTARPRWETLLPETRARLVHAAEHFVNAPPAQPVDWQLSHAAFHAFALLGVTKPGVLESLPAALWRAWAASLYEGARWDEGSEGVADVLTLAHDRAPDELRAAALDHIESGLASHVIMRDHLAAAVWDDAFAERLVELLADAQPEAREDISELLARFAFERIRPSLVAAASDRNADTGVRVFAGQSLVTHGTGDDWRAVLSTAYADEAFGVALVEKAVSQLRHVPDPPLEPAEVADLFTWVSEQFPPSEDPPLSSGWVSPREQIRDWRDSLLQVLVSNGSAASVVALRALVERVPDQDLIAVRLRDVLEQHRRNEFRPVAPEELRRLATSASSTMLVRNAAELRELIVRVIADIEEHVLHGDTPLAFALWDEQPTLRPKTEDAVADVVSNYIESRLGGLSATSLREVASRRPHRAGIPQRTDLLVHVRSGDETVAVIVECKGCWNPGLYSEMRTQLVGQYMSDRPDAEGLYLAFWFDPTDWDPTDPSRQRCAGMTRVEMLERLEAQAAELRAEGFGVSATVLDGSYRRRTGRS